MKKKKSNNLVEDATSLALAASVAAATAGAYFLYGSKDAKKNRKAVKSWTLKMKAEALEKIEKLKEIDEKHYHDSINSVVEKYNKLKNIEREEVQKIQKELLSHWKSIKNIANPTKSTKVVKSTIKKVVKKTPKKVTKKVSKK